jgi:PGF-CTERM protein
MRTDTLPPIAVLLVAVAVVGALAGAVAAADDATVTPSPSAANATATHNVTVVATDASAGNLTRLTVDYEGTGATTTLVPRTGIVAGIDRGDDTDGARLAATDEDVSANVTTLGTGTGERLQVSFDGGPRLTPGDELVVSFPEVENPPQGEYTVEVSLNGANGTANATLELGPPRDPTPTAEPTATPTPTLTPTPADETPTDESPTDETPTDETPTESPADGTNGGGPGFGVVAALVALLAVGALARR